MSQQKKKEDVALSSVFASGLLVTLKLIVGVLTGSIGIISEAAHSGLDFLAAGLTYFAVRVGDKPADKEHPYGHAKIESVSAFIETGLLFLTSAWIIYEAVHRLLLSGSEPIKVEWYSYAVILISIAVDYSRAGALNKIAKETKSQVLEADALHFSSDILSSIVVFIGLICVQFFHFDKADPIAAVFVSLFVLKAMYSLGKKTIDTLVDTAPEGIEDKITIIIKNIPNVIDIQKIRARAVGPHIFIDVTVFIVRSLSFHEVQNCISQIEEAIKIEIENVDLHVHAKPLPLETETMRERVDITAKNHGYAVHDITIYNIGERKQIHFDLELDADLPIKEAHQKASHLESEIKKELGEDIDITTHIEPYIKPNIDGIILEKSEYENIKTKIMEIGKTCALIENIHEINILKIKEKYLFISLHCNVAPDKKLEDVHNNVHRLKYMIKEEIKNARQVVIHAEPKA